MTGTDLNSVLTPTGGTGGGNMYADGTDQANSAFKGIGGTVFCLGADCTVDADGNLAGSWYFSPTAADEVWLGNADGTMYTEEVYAQWGHWLTVDGNDNAEVNTYSLTHGTSGTPQLGITGDLTDTEATYTGPAVGMSVHKTFDANGARTSIASGAFEATATLTRSSEGLRCSAAPSPGQRSRDDAGWTVTLVKTGFTGATAAGNANTPDNVGSGVWTATGYGAAGARPTGIHGGFNAHWNDGHAAGAYATRKE